MNLKSEYKLGLKYLHGIGTQKNLHEALKYIIKSANQGFIPARFTLAFIYLNDENIIYNKTISYMIFKSIADDENHPRAQLMIAMMNEHGEGVSSNKQKSLKYYNLSAYQGNIHAIYKLNIFEI